MLLKIAKSKSFLVLFLETPKTFFTANYPLKSLYRLAAIFGWESILTNLTNHLIAHNDFQLDGKPAAFKVMLSVDSLFENSIEEKSGNCSIVFMNRLLHSERGQILLTK